jgi:Zn finger protein HypA/HybF involved in hydrogenase expression
MAGFVWFLDQDAREESEMDVEHVALMPRCAECGGVWLPADEDRWRAYLDTDSELVFYCPECAEREFGEWRWRE